MINSIIILLLIGAVLAVIADLLANLARIEELRAVNKRLRRFEKAFKDYREETRKRQNENRVELVVKEEKDELPKFGGF